MKGFRSAMTLYQYMDFLKKYVGIKSSIYSATYWQKEKEEKGKRVGLS